MDQKRGVEPIPNVEMPERLIGDLLLVQVMEQAVAGREKQGAKVCSTHDCRTRN